MAIYRDEKIKFKKGYGDTNVNSVVFGEIPLNDVHDYLGISYWIDVKVDTSYIEVGAILADEGPGFGDTNINSLTFGEIPLNDIYSPRGEKKILSQEGDVIGFQDYFIDR